MKTSDKLLLFLISFFLIATLGNNLILDAEYKKMEINDPLNGYRSISTKPFKHILLKGGGFGYTEVRQGSSFVIKTTVSDQAISWKIAGDTLTVTYGMNLNENLSRTGHAFDYPPIAIITAPKKVGVSSLGIVYKVEMRPPLR